MNSFNLRAGVPVEIVLAFPQGKATKRGWMFGCLDRRYLFCSTAAGVEIDARLRDLGARRGDRVIIHQVVSYGPEGRRTSLAVYRAAERVGDINGGFYVPRIPGAVR